MNIQQEINSFFFQFKCEPVLFYIIKKKKIMNIVYYYLNII